ncbi:hypothetical protein PspLS_01248 [Pyricularia sp. CBS 133598]|nr:hypothetical protein PspLS_01248 [Pyricularia sp. CBS 133598]
MSADFWAGYISGAAGILIGNPLDVVKVRLQAAQPTTAASSGPILSPASPLPSQVANTPHQDAAASKSFSRIRALAAGTAAPVLGYGALNALLFVSYNRTEALLNSAFAGSNAAAFTAAGGGSTTGSNLWTTWIAGAVGGLATWVVSTPTELVKCRAQLALSSPSSMPGGTTSTSSWAVAKHAWRTEGGIRAFYFGGGVTALRDSIGYGFYFWTYELCSQWMEGRRERAAGGGGAGGLVDDFMGSDAARVLLAGGLAGVVTWASVFPLDTIKTRVQAQQITATSGLGAAAHGVVSTERTALLSPAAGEGRVGQAVAHAEGQKAQQQRRLGAVEIARQAYREGGIGVFFRGLGVCSLRAFIVNAAQWAVYEWIMRELGQGRDKRLSTNSIDPDAIISS